MDVKKLFKLAMMRQGLEWHPGEAAADPARAGQPVQDG